MLALRGSRVNLKSLWSHVNTDVEEVWAEMKNDSTKGVPGEELFLSSKIDTKAKAQRNKRLGETIALTTSGVGL